MKVSLRYTTLTGTVHVSIATPATPTVAYIEYVIPPEPEQSWWPTEYLYTSRPLLRPRALSKSSRTGTVYYELCRVRDTPLSLRDAIQRLSILGYDPSFTYSNALGIQLCREAGVEPQE